MTISTLEAWHQVVRDRDSAALDLLLADDVIFYSPVVHTPQVGKPITTFYLTAAMHVLAGDSFSYIREVAGEHDAILEFTTELQGIVINGVDMLRWNDAGQIVEFKVMLRPLKAVNLVHELMGAMLQEMAGTTHAETNPTRPQ